MVGIKSQAHILPIPLDSIRLNWEFIIIAPRTVHDVLCIVLTLFQQRGDTGELPGSEYLSNSPVCMKANYSFGK